MASDPRCADCGQPLHSWAEPHTVWACERWRELSSERDRYRQGLIDCATQAGADVSDGPPDWPSLEVWAVEAVREMRAIADEEPSRTSADGSRTL